MKDLAGAAGQWIRKFLICNILNIKTDVCSSNEDIMDMILNGDYDDIGAEKLRGLMKILPEHDEVRTLVPDS